jgi:hypothetical protein
MTTRTRGGIFIRGIGIAAVALGLLAFALGYLLHPMM